MNNTLLHYLQTSLKHQYRNLDKNIKQVANPEAPEALHRTRVAMRSLLRPWKGQGECFAGVDGLAAELGRDTGPLRDKQVLEGELEKRGLHYQALARREAIVTGCGLVG